MGEDRVHSEYLAELRGLEEFRRGFHDRHPSAPLDPEEPGVRRIIEAIAWFSARTRVTAQDTLRAASRRLFESYFESLLMPLPSLAMMQALGGDRLVDPRRLAKGSEVRLAAAGGVEGSYRTVNDLNIFPIWLERTRVFLRPEGGYRLVMQFQSQFKRLEAIETLSLHVRFLDDYLTSLHLLHQLRIHLERTSVVYDRPVDETIEGDACRTRFGPVWLATSDEPEDAPSLEALRTFFQFPESELFIHVGVPARKSERGWSSFALLFDLKPGWQEARRSSAEVFHLHCVPITNEHRETAEPVVADGLTSRHAISHPDSKGHYSLRSVIGVSEITKRGRTPLRPSVLPAEAMQAPGYDVEQPSSDASEGAPHRLVVHMPQAFQAPRTLAVDATWHQPWFNAHAIGKLAITLPGQFIQGLKLRLQGDVVPSQPSPLADATSALTDVLALRMRPQLTHDELVGLLRILCPSRESPYAALPSRILALSCETVPIGGADDAGVRLRYKLVVDRFEPEEEGLIWTFLTRVRDLVDIWSPEGPVELLVEAGTSSPSPAFLKGFAA